MSKETTTRFSLDATGGRKPKAGQTDWAAVDALTDADIDLAISEDADAAPELDAEWFAKARLVEPAGKVPVTIRLDRDVVDFFKGMGGRYQTKINTVLRTYMDHARTRSGE